MSHTHIHEGSSPEDAIQRRDCQIERTDELRAKCVENRGRRRAGKHNALDSSELYVDYRSVRSIAVDLFSSFDRLLVLVSCLEIGSPDLSGRRRREFVDELQVTGILVLGESIFYVLLELFGQRL